MWSESMFASPHTAKRESLLVLNSSRVSAVFDCCHPEKSMGLWRRLGKSVMLKIWSTAVTHRAPSPPQSHRSLLTNPGVCLRGAGEQASILGPLTLTLLPFSVTTSLVACFPHYSLNPCHFLLSLFCFYTLPKYPSTAHPHLNPPSLSLQVFPVIIMLKAALSPPRSSLSLLRRPAVCAFTCFVKFISFPTRSAVAAASSALSSAHNCRRVCKQLLVCAHVRRLVVEWIEAWYAQRQWGEYSSLWRRIDTDYKKRLCVRV